MLFLSSTPGRAGRGAPRRAAPDWLSGRPPLAATSSKLDGPSDHIERSEIVRQIISERWIKNSCFLLASTFSWTSRKMEDRPIPPA
eukprot:1180620-Prorocentrum_minimum.AAC.2